MFFDVHAGIVSSATGANTSQRNLSYAFRYPYTVTVPVTLPVSIKKLNESNVDVDVLIEFTDVPLMAWVA